MHTLYKKPLVNIFNASLKLGIFRDKMKITKVRPLYEKVIDMKSAITAQYIFYQLFKKYQKYGCVIKHTILTDVQNGFRQYKSTETATQTFTQSIQEATDTWLYFLI